MKLVTIQAAAFKSTFEVLKDILNDVNVFFRKDGMYIVTLDTARTSLVDIYLSADNFEEYECDQDEVIAGINISNTFKLLKTITNNDVLRIEINCKEYRDMSNIGNYIEIVRSGKGIKFKCEGDFANQETFIECVEDSPTISGLYSLKYLNIFTKATSMCASVQIIQETGNRFLILKYNVANLGELKFYLATKVSEDP
jgi:proliferating cell nuclear antigen